MKAYELKTRVTELEQLLQLERAACDELQAAYDALLTDYQRLERESVAAKAEMDRLRSLAHELVMLERTAVR